MKNGTPSSAVIMPTGISCGASRVLAKRSEMSRTVAPVSMLSGMSFLCRQEKSFLAMCGEINPANEIMPLAGAYGAGRSQTCSCKYKNPQTVKV